MSSSSTPSRSRAISAASSPLIEDNGSEPGQLTPRSKVKAMLAAIDDDSDGDHPRASAKLNGIAINGSSGRISPDGYTEKADGVAQLSCIGEESESSEEDRNVMEPRGKLASRLYGQRPMERATGSSSGEDDTGNAYERIKEQLLRENTDHTDEPAQNSGINSSEEDKLLAKIVPQRQRKVPISNSDSEHSHLESPLKHISSPGLFLTPDAPKNHEVVTKPIGNDGSDSDLPAEPQANARFLALVAKKREERQAKEEAQAKKRAERQLNLEARTKSSTRKERQAPSAASEVESDDDLAAERKFTQQARPTRKAGKKALEEMNRETQRMSRNMQLAHEAKTKKKITKDSLLARFNFRLNSTPPVTATEGVSSSTVASSAPASDVEGAKVKQTPPTSPAGPGDNFQKNTNKGANIEQTPQLDTNELTFAMDDELPSIEDMLARPMEPMQKGKDKAIEERLPKKTNFTEKIKMSTLTQRPIRVRAPKPSAYFKTSDADSDSDLEIVPAIHHKKKKLDIFDRIPEQKVTGARSLQTLRALAHLTSPSKQNVKSKAFVTSAEMHFSLQRQARQQAAKERAEKIQDLKDRGILIQTAEERQQDQAEVEDILEKARREADELTKKEKDAAKREREENGGDEEFGDSSDEDEDYEDDAEEPEVELSGSEEENACQADQEDGAEETIDSEDDHDEDEGGATLHVDRGVGSLVDDEASEKSDEQDLSGNAEEDELFPQRHENKRRSRVNRVIDEDEDEEDPSESSQHQSDLKACPENPFGPNLLISGEGPMGLTQAFAATMAESQTQMDDVSDGEDQEQDSLAFLGRVPDPGLLMMDIEQSQPVVLDSQPGMEQCGDSAMPDIDLHLSQSQIDHNSLDTTHTLPISTQYSDIPDPSQDVGFGLSSPIAGRFVSVPPSTADTVLLPGAALDGSPIVKKKGRLRRRIDTVPILSDVDEDSVLSDAGDELEASTNAFQIMKKAAKRPAVVADLFDKKMSEAKGMVEEQAAESEDEYAGLGGASDDESAAEDDEEVRKMIDEGDVKVDERKLAALYADNERSRDEKAVEKLFKDINNGMLRRKRGADFDLSDSEDDLEARRRKKQRDFAKMRKALLANENVGKIAEDPKKLAFLRAIEDRDDDVDEDLDLLEQPHESLQTFPASQDEEESQPDPLLPQSIIPAKRNRPLQASIPDHANANANGPPPQARRTRPHQTKTKKPSTLAEIRESVSFLVEEPNALPAHPHSDYASADENDQHQGNNDPFQIPQSPSPSHDHDHDSFQPRRRSTNPVIDRLSLKRAESATSASASASSLTTTTTNTTTTTTTTRLAFINPNTTLTTAPGFRIPSLLLKRRANVPTTQNDNNNHGITTAAATAQTERAAGGGGGAGGVGGGGGGDGVNVRKGGCKKKSSVSYFAREEERRRGVREGGKARREEEERRRMMRMGGRGGGLEGLGALGGGRWD